MYQREDFRRTQARYREGRCPCCGSADFENQPGAHKKLVHDEKQLWLCADCVKRGHDHKYVVAEILYLLAG